MSAIAGALRGPATTGGGCGRVLEQPAGPKTAATRAKLLPEHLVSIYGTLFMAPCGMHAGTSSTRACASLCLQRVP